MRLIDADALKEDIEQQCDLLRLMKDNDELIQISAVLESGFMAQIDKMPTIEERKKGKWIPVTKIYKVTEEQFPKTHIEWVDATEPDEIDGVRCSECGTVYDFIEARNWCSECGARMEI